MATQNIHNEANQMGIEVLTQLMDGSANLDLLTPRLPNIDLVWICRPQHFKQFEKRIPLLKLFYMTQSTYTTCA